MLEILSDWVEENIEDGEAGRDFCNWKYQYKWVGDNFDQEEMYDWCINNIGPSIDWHVRFSGIIFRKPEDAMLFKLSFM